MLRSPFFMLKSFKSTTRIFEVNYKWTPPSTLGAYTTGVPKSDGCLFIANLTLTISYV